MASTIANDARTSRTRADWPVPPIGGYQSRASPIDAAQISVKGLRWSMAARMNQPVRLASRSGSPAPWRTIARTTATGILLRLAIDADASDGDILLRPGVRTRHEAHRQVLDIQRLPHVQAVDDVRDVEHRGEAIAGLRPVGKGCAPDAEQRQGTRQIFRMLGRIGAFRQGDVDSVRTAAAFAADALEVEIDAIGLARGAAGRRQRPQALDHPRRGRPVESHARIDGRRAK